MLRGGVRNHRRWACSFHQNSNTCSTNSYSFYLSYNIIRQSKDFTHVQQSEGTQCFPPSPAHSPTFNLFLLFIVAGLLLVVALILGVLMLAFESIEALLERSLATRLHEAL